MEVYYFIVSCILLPSFKKACSQTHLNRKFILNKIKNENTWAELTFSYKVLCHRAVVRAGYKGVPKVREETFVVTIRTKDTPVNSRGPRRVTEAKRVFSSGFHLWPISINVVIRLKFVRHTILESNINME